MEIRRKTATFMGTRSRKGYKTTSFCELKRQSAQRGYAKQRACNATATAARRNNQKRRKKTSNEIRENPRVRIVTRVTIDGIQESSAGPINSSFPPSIPHFPVVWHTENAEAVDSLFARIRKKLFFSPVKMFPRIDLCSFRFGRDHGRAVYLHHASKREILISEVRTRVDIDITRDEMWILITGGKKKRRKRERKEKKSA